MKKNLVMSSMWAVYEKSYYARIYDTMGASARGRFEFAICENFRLDTEFWHSRMARLMTSEFREYVITTCESDKK